MDREETGCGTDFSEEEDTISAGIDITEDETSNKIQSKKKLNKTQQLKEDFTTLNDKFLRVMAEYDNYRKRTEREKQSLVSLGTSLAIERLLKVLDTLEMAAKADCSDPMYKKGVELTVSMFISSLDSLGVSEIKAFGDSFDPSIHNCVASEKSDEYESGIVIKVMQKGYKLGERVIRPAMVTVSA